MNRLPKARYTKEFREGAIKLAEAVGSSEASRRLSTLLKSLANWLRASKAGKLEDIGLQEKPQTEREAGLHRVKRELAEVTMERDLLKSSRRTLRRSCGEVPGHGRTATSISGAADVSAAGCVSQWVLCLAPSQAVVTRAAGGASRNGNPGGSPAYA